MLNYGNEVASLVSTAPAANGSSSGTSTLLILALPILLLVWMFWSTSRRQRAMRSFSSSLSVGDQIVTSSGIYGTVRHLDDQSAWVEVAEGTTLRIDRRAIAMKQADTTPGGAPGTTGPDHTGASGTSDQ